MTKNIDIAVTYHKEALLFENNYIKPIHAGKELSAVNLNIRGDNTGDNISRKNCHYAELTVLYWLWKNSNADFKGLFHYRRLFDLSWQYDNPITHIGVYNKSETPENILKELDLTEEKIEKLTDEYDMLIPYVEDFSYSSNLSISSHYIDSHIKEHLKLALDVIESDYPEYLETAVSTLSSTTNFFTNMFIMKKELFNECCEWLFHILFRIEEKLNLYSKELSLNNYQMRWAGFLGERLVGIFINHKIKNGVSYLNCPKVFVESPYSREQSYYDGKNYKFSIIFRPSKFDDKSKHFIYSVLNQQNCTPELNIIIDLLSDNDKNIFKKSCPIFNYYDNPDYNKIIKNSKNKFICFANENTLYDNGYFFDMCNTMQKNNSEIVISTYKTCNQNNITVFQESLLPYTLQGKLKSTDILMLNPNLYNVMYSKDFIKTFDIAENTTDVEIWWKTVLKASRVDLVKSYLCRNIKLNEYKFSKNNLADIKLAIDNINNFIQNYSDDIKFMYDNFKKLLVYQLICSNLKDISAKNELGQSIIEFVQNIIDEKISDKFDYKLEFYNYNNKFMTKLFNGNEIYKTISDFKLDLIADYINVYQQLQNNLHKI